MQSDIVCLAETHANSKDVLQYEGYKCFMNCRINESKKPSGGLATFIKRSIIHGIQLVDKSEKDMLWFKLDKGFFKFSKDLYLCFVYISPKNSSYTLKTNCDRIIFEKLERDISKFSLMGDIMVMGDLNAHINKGEQDFIVNDSDHVLDNFLPLNYVADNIQKFRNTEIHQNTNEYGKNIVDLCIDAQLRILNGRTIGDSIGKTTYHNYIGASIDDYCICNSNFLQNIVSFKVDEFNPILSDHCPIHVKILSQVTDRNLQDCLKKKSEDKNPSQFWKSVNQLKEKASNDPSCNISPKEWLNYFNKLMNIDHINSYENEDTHTSSYKNQNIEILNSEVTTEEVQKAAKKLKFGKASGPDGKPCDDQTHPDYIPTVFAHTKLLVSQEQLDKKLIRFTNARKRQLSGAFTPTQENKKLKLSPRALFSNSEIENVDPVMYTAVKLLSPPKLLTPSNIGLNKKLSPSEREMLHEEIDNLREEKATLTKENQDLNTQLQQSRLSASAIDSNPSRSTFYTGISYDIFVTIFTFLSQFLTRTNLSDKFPHRDQLFITLVKLRMDLPFEFIALQCGQANSTVNNVFWRWIDLMHAKLGFLVHWPDRETMQRTFAFLYFKSKFPRLTSIVDCFEIFIDRPKNLNARIKFILIIKA
ncbi:unnamed protein product [Mytilus edulis]|uniref:Transposase Helix-turn-helix domain-containing protein n=1 Tax=Mytilus edulis TaxID=6550 RepID=A0A8S3Q2M3_MYTED|nr:unnamed protein product [Mytilus edulis]